MSISATNNVVPPHALAMSQGNYELVELSTMRIGIFIVNTIVEYERRFDCCRRVGSFRICSRKCENLLHEGVLSEGENSYDAPLDAMTARNFTLQRNLNAPRELLLASSIFEG